MNEITYPPDLEWIWNEFIHAVLIFESYICIFKVHIVQIPYSQVSTKYGY